MVVVKLLWLLFTGLNNLPSELQANGVIILFNTLQGTSPINALQILIGLDFTLTQDAAIQFPYGLLGIVRFQKVDLAFLLFVGLHGFELDFLSCFLLIVQF